MSSTTMSRTISPPRNVVSRLRDYAASRQAERELDAVLAGRHGQTMREEILAVLNR